MSTFGWSPRHMRGGRLAITLALATSFFIFMPGAVGAAPDLLDLRDAVVVTSAELTKPESAAVHMLLDEVEKRSIVRWEVAHAWPADATPVIAIGTAATVGELAGTRASALGLSGTSLPAEGYRIRVLAGGRPAPAVLVAGNDSRGMLFLFKSKSNDCASRRMFFRGSIVPTYSMKGSGRARFFLMTSNSE